MGGTAEDKLTPLNLQIFFFKIIRISYLSDFIEPGYTTYARKIYNLTAFCTLCGRFYIQLDESIKAGWCLSAPVPRHIRRLPWSDLAVSG